jgi:uncharacterized protein (TIGR02246 family)
MSTATQAEQTAPSAQSGSSRDEAEIRKLIAAWSRALEAKDLDGLLANYAPDVLLFDVMPPYKTVGVPAIRALWERCLPHFPASFRSEHRDLKLTVAGDLAFCHGLHHIAPDDKAHPAGQSWIRVTACYRKIDGRWLTVHEHVSFPFDCATGQISPIVDPDVA